MSSAPLTLGEIDTAGTWRQAPPVTGLARTYRDLTGATEETDAGGLAVVWGRRMFSRGRPLPPGGVLLGIEVELVADVPRNGPEEFWVDVAVRRRAGSRPVVTIMTRLRRAQAEPFAEVAFVMLWPEAA